MLRTEIVKSLNGKKGNIAIILKDLTKDQWIFKLNENRAVPSASIIKILIMVEAFNQFLKGNYTLDQNIAIKEGDRVAFSKITESGRQVYTYGELITLMIILSDNTATNVLIDLLGYEEINDMSHKLGLKETVLKRKMMDFEAAKAGRQNETSPRDMAKLLEEIYRKKILTPDVCEHMIRILKDQKYKEMLPRYIKDDLIIAHKTGELENLNHDIGIFYLEQVDYLLGVFVTEADSNLEAMKTIGEISHLIYNHFHRETHIENND